MPRQSYPAYRQRPDKNLAVVTLTDAATGHRRDYYLGRYDTPESREAYHRLLASWDKLGHRLPPAPNEEAPRPESITVAEVMAAYWQWAQSYYRPSEGGYRDMVPTGPNRCSNSALAFRDFSAHC